MRDPIKSQLGRNFTNVYVWGARPFIKQALLLDAQISITHGPDAAGHIRILSHGAGQRSLTTLPWPLSLAQPHSVNFSVVNQAHDVMEFDEYTRSQIDSAIDRFLSGLDESDFVSISTS